MTNVYIPPSGGGGGGAPTGAAGGDLAGTYPNPTVPSKSNIPVTAQSGTTYTLVLADAGTTVECTNANPVTVTVPPNASVAFNVGDWVDLRQIGVGQVTIAAGAGVTLDAPNGRVLTAARYSTVGLQKRATNEWVLAGDLS